MKERGFHISITTGMNEIFDQNVLGGVSLAHDLCLVKAAILYADQVTLYSPAASYLLSLNRIKDLGLAEQVEIHEYLAPYLTTDPEELSRLRDSLRAYVAIQRKKYVSREEREFIRTMETALNWGHILETVERQARESQVTELVQAIKARRLHVHDFVTKKGLTRGQVVADLVGKAAPNPQRRESLTWTEDWSEPLNANHGQSQLPVVVVA
jgi:hypothetical protein